MGVGHNRRGSWVGVGVGELVELTVPKAPTYPPSNENDYFEAVYTLRMLKSCDTPNLRARQMKVLSILFRIL